MDPVLKTACCVFYTYTPRDGLMFLLGMEGISNDPRSRYWEGGKWGAFGGKKEPYETMMECCARESYEETAGCVYSLPLLKDIFLSRKYALRICRKYKKGLFGCFFVWVPYRDYPSTFRLCKQFCQYLHLDISPIEKTHLRWFRPIELQNAIDGTREKTKNMLRHKLEDVFQVLLNQRLALGHLSKEKPPEVFMDLSDDTTTPMPMATHPPST